MLPTRLISLLSLSLAIVVSNVFAGDYAGLKFIGFSADGAYMAFEESGQWDGSGGDYATTYYIDVEDNKYALPPSKFEWSYDSMKESAKRGLYARYQASVAAGLRKLKIARGNTGSQVVAHLLTDWSYVKPIETDGYWIKDGKQIDKKLTNYAGAFLDTGDATEKVIFNPWLYVNNYNTDSYYELTLLKTPARTMPCENSDDALKIELTLKDNTHHQDIPLQVLQKDKDLPPSRHCPYGYRIEQVYFYKNRLAVFLNVFSQGFEGPDMRYRAVTGLMEYSSVPPGD
jgi:predicted secreted protein